MLNSYKKKKWKPPSENEKGGENPTGLTPRNRKACHSIRKLKLFTTCTG
jgi:hypothetical protein